MSESPSLVEEDIPLGLLAGLALTFLCWGGGGDLAGVRVGAAANCKVGGGRFGGGGAGLASRCNVGGGAFPFGRVGGAFFGCTTFPKIGGTAFV